MEIKIAVAGALGRVGRCITQCVAADPQAKLVASVIRSGSHTQDEPFISHADPKIQPKYFRGIAAVTVPFDVLIDFSSIESFDEHLAYCCKHKQRMVIGVTGLSQKHKTHLLEAAQVIPIVYSPNMSIGINVSFKLLEIAARALNEHVGVAIHETHRQHKKDKPSGTALRMGEIIAEAWGTELPCPAIDFASSRVGEVMGEHHVLFALADEKLVIQHSTENRSAYARGALQAAKWLMQQPAGLYDMQDVLSLRH